MLALSVNSVAGACGNALDLPDAADLTTPAAVAPLVTRVVACNGAQSVYQVSVGAAQSFQAYLTDLAPGGARNDLSGSVAAAYQATRPGSLLVLAPLATSFSAASVVNAATFTAGLAPGSMTAIFGSGLVGAKGNTTVELDATSLPVISANSFQVNTQIPVTVAAGVHTLRVRSGLRDR